VTLLKEADDASPEERAEDLAIIDSELSRMNAMMREILDFANGGESIRRTGGSVPRLLDELADAVRPELDAKEIFLKVESEYSGEWSFDYPRMRRVLENLVRNAAAVVGPGGKVSVRSGETAEGLRFVVEDTGPGIPEEVRDTLFEPFVTFGTTEGTGLGLAIVRAFTERHGGTVRFETSSSGTRFLLDFPKPVLA
jgi:signal transduction histidine kinase